MNPQNPAAFPVFTYGTLRAGQVNAAMTVGCAAPAPVTGTVDGYALYANTSNTYPYLVAEEGAGPVTGTLYMMAMNDRFMRIYHMEVGAGYDVEYLPVTLPDGSVVEALAWVWRRPYGLGHPVESGDWAAWKARAVQHHGRPLGG